MSETADGEPILESESHPRHKAAGNGAHPVAEGEGPSGGRGETADSYARAEETFDRIGQQVGQQVAQIGKWLNRFTLRAREEAEDMMVEAHDLRRRWQSKPPA